MAGFRCTCSEVIKTNLIPNPNEWLIISDNEFDSYQGVIDAESLYTKMKSMIVCGKCGRLWVFWNGFSESPVEYLKASK